MIKENMPAPDFNLRDKDGIFHNLKDLRGSKVVLYFYPKDGTPGCTRQAIAFKNAYDSFLKLNTVVIGISKDGEESHQRFVKKNNLPFLLLSDPDLEAIKAYGVWQEKTMFGKKAFGVVRSTFVIDEGGIILKIYKRLLSRG